MPQFFVSTPLGSETACLAEMQSHWPNLLAKDAKPQTEPFPKVQIFDGGLEFDADLFVGLQFNFFLKTANRVLMRVDSFRVRDLPKFFNRFHEIPWKQYLDNYNDVELEIAAQKSRLNNEKRLEESALAALQNCLPTKPAGMGSKQKIFIRMYDDQCTISVDTTGEHLHKRGWAVLKGEAPIRETLASFLLQEMMTGASLEDVQKTHLLDPMMGSGTFLSEARSFFHGNFTRPFAFQNWAACPKLFKLPLFASNYKHRVPQLFASYNGIDISERMIEVAQENWNSLEATLEKSHKSSFTKAELSFQKADAVKEPLQMAQPLWMILNPPYGERISNEELYIEEFLERLCINYNPQRLGVILPEKQLIKRVSPGYRLLKQVKLSNGGIRCVFSVLTRV